MTGVRLRFAAAVALFLGWLGWLGVAVLEKGKHPVVSRSQLTAATHVVVAEVTVGPDGLPAPTAKVVETLSGPALPAETVIEVLNLPSALPPGAGQFPGPGRYLVPVVNDGPTYRVAGLPSSPGYDAATPARPAVYVWDEATRAQLVGLGIPGPRP